MSNREPSTKSMTVATSALSNSLALGGGDGGGGGTLGGGGGGGDDGGGGGNEGGGVGCGGKGGGCGGGGEGGVLGGGGGSASHQLDFSATESGWVPVRLLAKTCKHATLSMSLSLFF